MNDEFDKLRATVVDIKSELDDMKIAMHNKFSEHQRFNNDNYAANMLGRNLGQLAGKLFFGNENFMMKSMLQSFNSFANHYSKLSAKNQYSFIGQRFAGGNVSPSGSYLVGERGAEIFTPNQVGRITSGTNENKNIYINLNISTPDIKNFYNSKSKITEDILKRLY